MVAHYADRLCARVNGEELAEIFFVAVFRHFVAQNCICVLHDADFLRGDFAEDANAQSRTGERLTPNELARNAELFADRAHFVFKQIFQRFNDAQEIDVVRERSLVVVRFNHRTARALAGSALAAFDAVGINRALCEKRIAVGALFNFVPKDFIKRVADDVALFFGVGHAF